MANFIEKRNCLTNIWHRFSLWETQHFRDNFICQLPRIVYFQLSMCKYTCSGLSIPIFLDIFRDKMQNFTSLSNAFDILPYLKILPSTKGSPSLDFHRHIHLKTVIQHNHRRSYVSHSVKPVNHLASLRLGL